MIKVVVDFSFLKMLKKKEKRKMITKGLKKISKILLDEKVLIYLC
ncbi:hypothetical protein HanIR_Chr08g0383591 [Helianthus annuus]|nr:hypothetical protein HanIR_Chr08g0383591 [Helianthus annuus]